MSDKDEALRLADALKGHAPMATRDEAAAMLRKLVAEREADRAAMRRALEALEYHVEQTRPIERTFIAITHLRQRLEQP